MYAMGASPYELQVVNPHDQNTFHMSNTCLADFCAAHNMHKADKVTKPAGNVFNLLDAVSLVGDDCGPLYNYCKISFKNLLEIK